MYGGMGREKLNRREKIEKVITSLCNKLICWKYIGYEIIMINYEFLCDLETFMGGVKNW